VYINTTSTGGTTYRMGKPTKSIIAAGVDKVFYFGKDEKTTNLNEIVAAGIESIYGTQKYAYSNR
jgi:deoxycytidylate deaminase